MKGMITVSNFLVDFCREVDLLKIFDALGIFNSDANAVVSSAGDNLDAGKDQVNNQTFADIIQEASAKYGVDQNVISAVINQESSFNPKAVSSCGAEGLMQLMPSTARSLGVQDPFNAEQNIMAGTCYLKQKLDEFNGNLPMALAAYNAGSGAVRKYGGVPPYKETQAYVNRIMKSIDQWA